jgi:hypothetical protein
MLKLTPHTRGRTKAMARTPMRTVTTKAAAKPLPRAAKTAKPIAMKRGFEIVNPLIKGDLRHELGGQRIRVIGGKRVVFMTTPQAKWFLEHGAIRPLGTVTAGGDVVSRAPRP